MPRSARAVLGVEIPIVQAPIGSASTPELAARVALAGGLGVLAASWLDPARLRAAIRKTRALTRRPFAVNLVLEWPQHERLAIALEERVPVISFFWGGPAPYLPAIREANAAALYTAGSVGEAAAAARAGIDLIVAQGIEAGGHVRGEVGLMALLPAVVDAAGGVPVLAAGGIADRRGVAAALALGAQGVWVGTRFLTSAEAGIHPVYRDRLLEAGAGDTVLTSLFDGGWPGAPHRALRNSTVRRWEEAGCPAPPARPGEGEAIAVAPDGRTLYRYGDDIPLAGTAGEVEAMALYAGQGVGLIREVAPAGAIVAELAEGM